VITARRSLPEGKQALRSKKCVYAGECAVQRQPDPDRLRAIEHAELHLAGGGRAADRSGADARAVAELVVPNELVRQETRGEGVSEESVARAADFVSEVISRRSEQY